jgi:hypothetical protein
MPGEPTVRPVLLGGLGVLTGALLIGGALALGLLGLPVGLGSDQPEGRVLEAGLIALGLGSAILAIVGAAPWDRRLIRFALVVFSTGLLITTLTSHVPSDDPLIFAFLGGGLLATVGVIVLALGLLLSPGAPRRLAALFGGGILSAVLGLAVQSLPAGFPAAEAAMLLLLLAVWLVMAGLAAFGLLAMRADRPGPNALRTGAARDAGA